MLAKFTNREQPIHLYYINNIQSRHPDFTPRFVDSRISDQPATPFTAPQPIPREAPNHSVHILEATIFYHNDTTNVNKNKNNPSPSPSFVSLCRLSRYPFDHL